ncbi:MULTISPECIES: hypothetical protein [unclassified Marinobacter]|uniref:hypothetical protein n=1 Tax=unclassified Marinobacter TaxID=83889 RepID=UPI001267D429|nr:MULTISPECIES: hypothetical protein [unclassified Marinobacter]QFS87617.1 hypothetical protein FIV08_12360 [Marinobacter sp. THAF197a]QFT51402.1 hypothetical protein FIU96_12275 [Marinobacter sp. THAF39]
MHFISERDILKEIRIVMNDAKNQGHRVTKILAQDFELEELAILARRRFNGLKQKDPNILSFTYKGVTITRDNRPADPHQH